MTYNFRIGDVFEKIDTAKIRAKANDFPETYSDEYCVPLLTAGADNQGFARYARKQDCTDILHNVISVSANGANSGICFYQPDNFAVLQDSYAIRLIEREIQCKEEGLYLTCALNKAVRDNHDWSNKAGWNHIKDDTFELPVIPSSDPSHTYTSADIDWQYMRDRIMELEHDRIAELDAYLKATGLDDYELTEEDKKVLSLSKKSAFDEDTAVDGDCGIRKKEFLLKDIAHLEYGNKFDKNKMSHSHPQYNFVSRTGTNNGISDFVDSYQNTEPYPAGTVTLAFGGSIGSCFIQPTPYYTGQNVGVISLPENVSEEAKIYFVSSLEKVCKNKYVAFADEINKHFKTDLSLSLPVTSSGEPDWDYMEKYIRAMEKVVIADVVKWKDKEIEATKKIVGVIV